MPSGHGQKKRHFFSSWLSSKGNPGPKTEEKKGTTGGNRAEPPSPKVPLKGRKERNLVGVSGHLGLKLPLKEVPSDSMSKL